jgi:pre-mRNA-splicing factor CWC22
MLDVFRFDPEYTTNEELWSKIRKEILGDDDASGSSDSESGSGSSEEERCVSWLLGSSFSFPF